jgi:hypothetical protein
LSPGGARLVLRLDAVFAGVVGIVLALSTWDGLYDALLLPKPSPALLAQVGGIAIAAFAYLLWLAGDSEPLRRPVATAAAAANGGAAVAIGLWLVLREEFDLMIESGGIVVLAVAAVVLAGFALAEAAIGFGRGERPSRAERLPR